MISSSATEHKDIIVKLLGHEGLTDGEFEGASSRRGCTSALARTRSRDYSDVLHNTGSWYKMRAKSVLETEHELETILLGIRVPV